MPHFAKRDTDSPQPADLVRRLRQTRANMIGTDDEDHYFDCHEAAAEIERLRLWGRLTDAERFVLREVRDVYADEDDLRCNEIAYVVDRLLERTQ